MLEFKVKFTYFLLIYFCLKMGKVENKSVFGIGTRIYGDQLLVKDKLTARQFGAGKNAEVEFRYSIPEPITYIEIFTEENVFAKVDFSYQNDLVTGTVKDVINSSLADTDTQKKPTFDVLITIFGFNKTMLNVSPAYILNRDQQFDGILRAESLKWKEDAADLDVTSSELFDEFSTHSTDYNEQDDSDNNNNNNDEDYEKNFDDFDDEFARTDKIIELGERQAGDYLIYETDQLSPTLSSDRLSSQPTNHTVVFYYIDDYRITFAKFIVFDHYIDKSNEYNDTTLSIKYSYLSFKSLKAKITDTNATSLFVKMQLYGYRDADFDFDLLPFLNEAEDYDGHNPTLNEVMMKKLSMYKEKLRNMQQLITVSGGFSLKTTKMLLFMWLATQQLIRNILF